MKPVILVDVPIQSSLRILKPPPHRVQRLLKSLIHLVKSCQVPFLSCDTMVGSLELAMLLSQLLAERFHA